MAALTAARLIAAWNPGARGPAQRRLAALLAAIDGADAGRDDTLGGRNRRLLSLHRALVRTPLDGRVTCTYCSADNEFAVPIDAILTSPAPDSDVQVRIRSGPRTLTFRLPRMADIEAASGAGTVDDVRRAVLERCRIGGGPEPTPVAAAERLGRRFEALDPAASIVVNITCSGCGRHLRASLDLATFVARDLDRVVDGLYREVDVIARAYGWDEPAILALPADRRKRYVSMILARSGAGARGRAV